MSNIHSNRNSNINSNTSNTKSKNNTGTTKDKKKHSDKTIEKTTDEPIVFKATNVAISTCTVLTNLNSKINLGLISRFIAVHDQYSPELDNKTGGIYNLEFYGNCARGETLIDKIKDEFNNQATIKFKYWGFRNVNVKFFANGKLQMTGLKYEDEAKEVANLLINIINNITIPIKTNIESLKNIDKTYDFQLIYDPKTNNVFYYRKYYDRFLTPYIFDTDIIYTTPIHTSSTDLTEVVPQKQKDKTSVNGGDKGLSQVNYNRKGFIKGIHDTYNDTIEEGHSQFLKENEWYGDTYIKTIISKIEHIKTYFIHELEKLLHKSNTLVEVKTNIDTIIKKYTDFKFTQLDKILSDINKNLYSDDEQTLSNLKNEIFKYHKQYIHLLEKKVNRLVNIRTIDITICNAVKNYILKGREEKSEKNSNVNSGNVNSGNMSNSNSISINMSIPLEKLELLNEMITEPHNYYVSGTETVLINSDLSINHNINLKKISKILKNEGLFNTYDPDEYPGVLTKYYYNPNNVVQGICNCPVHCSTREKHSICTKVTISVFRPGSIIITGARKLLHLMAAHDKILKILKDNIKIIKGVDNEDDHKQIAILNNEFRKISKKTRLFFIKKEQIVDYSKSITN
jgi:TATA-box binding protein (TBP) (component of TFIID and TFIIIB)